MRVITRDQQNIVIYNDQPRKTADVRHSREIVKVDTIYYRVYCEF